MKNGGKSGGFGYVGRIKNSGAQVVQAPIQTTVQKKGTVRMGNDLRSGKKRRRRTVTFRGPRRAPRGGESRSSRVSEPWPKGRGE